jgi:hypothetical protein
MTWQITLTSWSSGRYQTDPFTHPASLKHLQHGSRRYTMPNELLTPDEVGAAELVGIDC